MKFDRRHLPLFALAALALIAWIIAENQPRWSGFVGYPIELSPNYNQRPFDVDVNCIVVHSTAQTTLASTIAHFLTPVSRVSAHFVVDKDGAVVQMVPLTERAWHAGVSELDGVPGVNDYSIGIELVNMNDGKDPYTDAQYRACAEIVRRCRKHYQIPDSRIVSHASIALPAGRKTDPEGFDFPKLLALASRPTPTRARAIRS